MKLVLAVTLAIISTTTAVDLTREPGTNGSDVVQACIAIISQPRIFSQDQQLLRRIAYVETRDGTDPDTYAGNNDGGIWQLSETKYLATKTDNQQLLQDIATHFNIRWTATVWSDLRKPLFSALAARLYFEVITAEIPLSPNINAQGNYWATYYTSSGGTQTEFVNAINELAATEACDISGIDLYFVMDESGSVGSANFDIMKTFVYNIADSFEIGPDDVQIGVMTYSSSHTFHFVLNTYTIKSQVLSAILSLPYGGGSTNTAGALDAIRLQAFTESNGAHPSAFGIPRVAVVITDGDSNDFAATVASANLLHDAGVITFAIGIAGANEAELDEIASEPSNKGFVSSFDAQRLRALQVSISQRACEASPDLTIGENITGVLQERETQYLNYPIPESGGITLQVNVNEGTIVLYASSVIQTPNEAFHDIKIVTNSYEDVFINPNNLSDPNAGTVFIAITSADDSSSNTTTVMVNTQPGDVSTEPVDVTITGLRSQDLGGIVIIECTATGKPQPTVEWKKDGVTLSLNVVNMATRDNNTNISTLTTSLASSDAGIYMCVGSNVIQNVVFNDTAIVNLAVTGSFITPHFGNQLGGTPVLIRGIFNESVNISCVFGTIETRGVRISETQAMCISPRLDIAGPVEFNVFLNDALVPNNSVRFYAQHYSDLADVTIDPKDLIVSPGQERNINWITSSLLPTADSDINVDIILHEAAVSFNKTIRWIGKYMIRSDVSNDGIATIKIPRRLSTSSSSFDEFNSSYSLIAIQIAVSASSTSNNQYWRALKELEQTTDTRVTVGRWTHVLFRRYANDVPRSDRRRIDKFLCSNWLNSNSSHFLQDSNDLDPCPCNRLQAELPQSGFTPRITPGKKIIDEFLHGNEIVCYEPRSANDEDAGNGIYRVSQECCYNQRGNLLVGEPYGGSANAQPSSTWENHFVFDLSPFLSCCVMNARYLEYYEKRPSDNCSQYEPFNAGWMHGDPHLLTLDGHQYTFNGRGEFILIETRDDRFTLQGRMIPAENEDGTESLGTVFSAIVAKQYDSDVVEFRASNIGVLLFINSLEIEIEVSLPEAYNSVIVSNKGNDTYSATFSTGVYLEVMQRNGFLSTIVVSLLPTYFDLTQGLMGVYNGDPRDDLLPRNSSTPLPLNSSMEKVHYEFGLTWILSDSSQSLFSYDSSSDFSSFYDPTFTPAFSPQFNNSELEEQANLLCQGDFECLFDIAATGRVEIGNATLEQQAIIENTNEITKPIICNPSCINGVCVANDTCSCFFRYKGDLCNNEDSCAYNANPSPCEDSTVGWFFNSETEQCQFGGCEGRGNIFTSMAECVKSCGCPGGATPNRQCLLNPCSFSTCRAFPNAQCEVDACDSCMSRYTVGLTEVTTMCDASCDNNTERFNCLVDPCDNAYCPNFPDANCLPDYCGGCSARFYDTFGVEVTDTCSECPDDKPELNCPFNLCDHQKCLNIPDTDCVFDVCGGCTARFYLGNEEVTDQCMFCEVSGQIFTSSGGTCPEKTCENSGQVICSAVSRPGCDCPVGMVLDMLNNTCVIPDDCPCPDCDPLPDNCSVITTPSPDEQCGCDTCEECPLGEVFHDCRSCPRTCAEQIDQSLCTTVCERGCGCPNGELLDEEANRCVSVDECPKLNICALPAERGICNGNIKRYFYNSATKICELFEYGGCFGNENNFFTLHDCEKACSAKPPTCTPTFCAKERRAMCYLPNADQNSCSKGYSVSNCQVCHYSSDLQSFSCGLDCIDVNGEYDDTCIRNWGVCLRRSYLPIFRSIPSSERIPENYKCIEYRCD